MIEYLNTISTYITGLFLFIMIVGLVYQRLKVMLEDAHSIAANKIEIPLKESITNLEKMVEHRSRERVRVTHQRIDILQEEIRESEKELEGRLTTIERDVHHYREFTESVNDRLDRLETKFDKSLHSVRGEILQAIGKIRCPVTNKGE